MLSLFCWTANKFIFCSRRKHHLYLPRLFTRQTSLKTQSGSKAVSVSDHKRCRYTPETHGEYISFVLFLLQLDSSVELIILPSKQFFLTRMFLFIPPSFSLLPTISTCLDYGDLSPETQVSLPNPPSSHCLLRAQLWLRHAPDQKLPTAPPTAVWPKFQLLPNTAFLIR